MSGLVLVAAGGTGGHMFPAMALCQKLKERGREVAVLTDRRGARYLTDDLPRHVISAGSPSGSLRQRLEGAFSLSRGLVEAMPILRHGRPSAAAAFGGYACFPAAAAATLNRVPLLVHEQNAVFGRANRVVARLAQVIALSFADTEALPRVSRAGLIISGNPVRPGFQAPAAGYAPPGEEGVFRLLVMGGSQGARVFSDVVPAAIALLPPAFQARLELSQQCRPEDIESVRAAYASMGLTPELAPFFADAATRMASAHLLISRSGASTVAELLLCGSPAILVPYPFAADGHQLANATRLNTAGAAKLMPQDEFTPETLARQLMKLMSAPDALAAMSAKAVAFSKPDAAELLADAVLDLAKEGRP